MISSKYSQIMKQFSHRKLLTLCEVIDFPNQRILLGFKKCGFGAGNYNGFGGKVEKNESILDAAKRECKEEANIDLIDCNKIGIIYFSFTYLEEVFEVHVYYSTKWKGTISETDEMKPIWFAFEDIPYDKMWKDDTFWMPYLLRSKDPEYFIGAAYFDKDNVMLNHDFKSIHDDKQQIDFLLSGQYEKLDLDYSVLVTNPTESAHNNPEIDIDNESKSFKIIKT
eukprot:152564_1